MRIDLDIDDETLERIMVAALKDTREMLREEARSDAESNALIKACSLLIAHYRSPF